MTENQNLPENRSFDGVKLKDAVNECMRVFFCAPNSTALSHSKSERITFSVAKHKTKWEISLALGSFTWKKTNQKETEQDFPDSWQALKFSLV